jgi:hypothetical protein
LAISLSYTTPPPPPRSAASELPQPLSSTYHLAMADSPPHRRASRELEKTMNPPVPLEIGQESRFVNKFQTQVYTYDGRSLLERISGFIAWVNP